MTIFHNERKGSGMTIDRLGPVDPVSRYGKTSKGNPAERTGGGDSIHFSSEAKNKAEFYNALEIARATPDVRLDRIAEIKQKLQDPNYIDSVVLDSVADRIIDILDI